MEYQQYLSLLSNLLQEIEHLTETAGKKREALQEHDLDQLNDCIKQEQAISLRLRGLEQKREKILSALGYSQITLQEMPKHCPKEYEGETRNLAERISRAYQMLQSIQTASRTMMEHDLRLIQKELENRGIAPEMDENYQQISGAQPPEMRTDFRA